MEPTTHPGLARDIRRWDLVALVLNVIIGAGIFGLPSKLHALVGAYSLLAYLLCAIPIILIILCFAEVGSRFQETGGPYLYARQAFGPVVGFEVGWLLWLGRLTAFAALCNLFVDYLAHFWPASAAGLWRASVVTLLIAALAIINLLGVRTSSLASNLFTIGKLLPLLLFAAVGLFFVNRHNYSFGNAPDYDSFSKALFLVVFALSGFETAVIPAGEVREPRRHMPFALLTGIALVVLIYILIQIVCTGILPRLADSPKPLADAASRFVGPVGGSVMSLAAMISVTGTLNSTMLAAPRLLFAMSEQGQLPRILMATHATYRTPHVAIGLCAVVMLALTLSGTFLSALTLSTIIKLLTYAATCAALPVLRSKSAIPPPAFKTPGGRPLAVAALALCLWLLSSASWSEAVTVTIAAGLGLLFHFVFRG